MDEQNVHDLDNLSDEELEDVAGGWIVDMGPQPDESYNRYVYIDYFGNVQTYTSTLEDAQYIANNNKATGGFYNSAIMTLEQYEERFGHSL